MLAFPAPPDQLQTKTHTYLTLGTIYSFRHSNFETTTQKAVQNIQGKDQAMGLLASQRLIISNAASGWS